MSKVANNAKRTWNVMRIQRAGIALALLMALGCRSASVAHRAAKPDADHSPRVAAAEKNPSVSESLRQPAEVAANDANSIRQVSVEATNDASSPVTSVATTLRISIHAAIETALSQNPDLVALRQAEGVGTATLGVAQTYPFNPFVQIQATPYQSAQNAGPGTTYHYVLLMQQIQLGHQQQHREEAACAALNGIRWNVLQAELLNVAQTERLYFAAVYQRGLRDLADLNAENNGQLLAILQSRKDTGDATESDVAIVRLDARSTRQQQKLAEANLQTALLDLKRHLCLQPDEKIDLDDDVALWNWLPAESTHIAALAGGRPDVMAARADADTARANSSLANASRIPDLQIGPYYQRNDSGTTFLGFRAQMDLPVVNNGIPLLRQREAEFYQRAMTAQQLTTRARLEAEAAADRYERARHLTMEFGDTPHTALPIELQRLEEQFKAGEVDILRVLQSRTSLLQSQRADLDALNELMLAAVAVTAASGTPLESIVAGPNSKASSRTVD